MVGPAVRPHSLRDYFAVQDAGGGSSGRGSRFRALRVTGTIDGAAVTSGQIIPLLPLAVGFHTYSFRRRIGGQRVVHDRHVQDGRHD